LQLFEIILTAAIVFFPLGGSIRERDNFPLVGAILDASLSIFSNEGQNHGCDDGPIFPLDSTNPGRGTNFWRPKITTRWKFLLQYVPGFSPRCERCHCQGDSFFVYRTKKQKKTLQPLMSLSLSKITFM
jgi:hypothetical protein